MIRRFRVQNFKVLRDVTLDLTPLHVLIGPNDSGKTSLLEALAALCRSVDHPLEESFLGFWEGRELVAYESTSTDVALSADLVLNPSSYLYDLTVRFGNEGRAAVVKQETLSDGGRTKILPKPPIDWSAVGFTDQSFGTALALDDWEHDAVRRVRDGLNRCVIARWTARTLALPSALNPLRGYRVESNGFGLPSLLDAILSEDRQLFDALEARFCEIFPQIDSIQIPQSDAYDAPVDPSDQVWIYTQTVGKAIRFRFKAQRRPIPASQVSDGMLYVLGYLALLYSPEPPRLLLIEEPENGIHPNRLKDVLGILRSLIAEHPETQVLMTTHSPYVLDEFTPEEVTLCRRRDDGAVAVTRLSESEAVKRQLDLFTLGEIWTAEGDDAIAEEFVGGREAMKVLLVSEGIHEASDPIYGEPGNYQALEVLVRRLTGRDDIAFTKVKSGDKKSRKFRLQGKGHGFTKLAVGFMRQADAEGFDALVFLTDLDKECERTAAMDAAQDDLRSTLPRACGVAAREFDAWMLADEQALSAALGVRVPTQADPERERDPKSLCVKLRDRSGCGLRLRDLYAAYAERADLDVIGRRCPTGFAPFASRVAALATADG